MVAYVAGLINQQKLPPYSVAATIAVAVKSLQLTSINVFETLRCTLNNEMVYFCGDFNIHILNSDRDTNTVNFLDMYVCMYIYNIILLLLYETRNSYFKV